MDIRTNRNDILPAAHLSDLYRRSNACGLMHLAAHLVLVAASGLAIALAPNGWLQIAAMLVHGVFLAALFAPLHECVHRTPFKSRRLNDLVAVIIGLLHFLPARYFRHFHFAHHRHTQDPAKDPELARVRPSGWWSYVSYLSGYYYWRTQLRYLFGGDAAVARAAFLPQRERGALVREARFHVLFYLLILVALPLVGRMEPLLYWFAPMLMGQPFLRAYLLAEHGSCPEIEDMLANTRTTYTTAAVRFLMWNMPYHVEHHVYPAVPFHALPALNGRIADKLAITADGYRAFHRGFAGAFSKAPPALRPPANP